MLVSIWWVEILAVGILPALALGWFLKLGRDRVSDNPRGPGHMLELRLGLKLIALYSLLVMVPVVVVVGMEKVGPDFFMAVLAFAVLGLVALFMLREKILVDEDGLTRIPPFGSELNIPWSAVEHVRLAKPDKHLHKKAPVNRPLKITARDGRGFTIHGYIAGTQVLKEYCQRHLQPLQYRQAFSSLVRRQ